MHSTSTVSASRSACVNRLKRQLLWLFVPLLFACLPACAGSFRERLAARHEEQLTKELEHDEGVEAASSSDKARVVRDVAYGQDAKQRMDIYLPQRSTHAPVIFMVHGGAWRLGDKARTPVVEHKVARWVTQGFVFISVNYRLLPKTGPLEQAQDVVKALAMAQSKAASWGADPTKFILMGHSAGAHLVSLVNAAPEMAYALGAKPWLGTVSLDSAAYDVVKIMQAKHPRLYDKAFGKDANYWRSNSPAHVLTASAKPLLAVCSKPRADDACVQSADFVAKLQARGVRARVLEQDLSHGDINTKLGLAGSYTDAVEAFMAELGATGLRPQ